MKTIADVMTRDVVTLFEEDSLADVAEDFARYQFRHIPVVDDGRLVGIISQRDILRVTLGPTAHSPTDQTREARFRDETFVEEIMQPEPITARSDEPLASAARRMLDHNISALPVVDAGGQLVGIVTVQDVLRVVANDL